MKPKHIYLFVALYFLLSAYQSSAQQKVEYSMRIILKNDWPVKGFLYQVTDSTVTILSKEEFQIFRLQTRGLYSKEEVQKLTKTFAVSEIETIQIQEVARHWSTVVKWAGTGLLAGAAIGLPFKYAPDSESSSQLSMAPVTGIIGTVLGAAVGTAIKRHKLVKSLILHGSKSIFQQYRIELDSFLFKEEAR
jgi:hypothetical protein